MLGRCYLLTGKDQELQQGPGVSLEPSQQAGEAYTLTVAVPRDPAPTCATATTPSMVLSFSSLSTERSSGVKDMPSLGSKDTKVWNMGRDCFSACGTTPRARFVRHQPCS